jgi:magnesium-protoporphyrin O-methyltransferase
VDCCRGELVGAEFDRATAQADLRRFRRRGPIPSTRRLIEDLQASRQDAATLLDVGGGVGAIHHALLDAGVATAVQVDLSPDYIAAAREEAERRGHGDRVSFVHADFLEAAPRVEPADIVTLDRVVCCYPDMERLLTAAADKTRRILGAVYPRDVWWVRAGAAVINALRRLRRTDFRVFVHSPGRMADVLRRRGLEPRSMRRTFVWEIVTYARS